MQERLKEIRCKLGYTQAAFAAQLGITQTAYSMIENGYRPLSSKYIRLLSATFRVSEQWLKDGVGDPFLSSPYLVELSGIFGKLHPENQQFLITMARKLMKTQAALDAKAGNSGEDGE